MKELGPMVVAEGLRNNQIIFEGVANKPVCSLDWMWEVRSRRVKNFG